MDGSDYMKRPAWENIWPGGGITIMLGQADEDIGNGTSGDVSILDGDLGSEADTGITKSCYNRGPDISTGTYVNVIRRGGGFECFPLTCD